MPNSLWVFTSWSLICSPSFINSALLYQIYTCFDPVSPPPSLTAIQDSQSADCAVTSTRCTRWVPDIYQCQVEKDHKLWNDNCELDFPLNFFFLSFSSDPVFPKFGTVQTGPTRWRSGVFWSVPGCLQITCLTLCFEHSAVSPAKGPTPSARRLQTTTSTILSEMYHRDRLHTRSKTLHLKPDCENNGKQENIEIYLPLGEWTWFVNMLELKYFVILHF